MATNKSNNSNFYDIDNISWRRFLIVTLIGGVIFLKSYLGIIALGVLLAYLFTPIQEYFERKTKSIGLAATITTILSILLLGIPIIIILVLAVNQTLDFINALNLGALTSGGVNIDNELLKFVDKINEYINNYTGTQELISEEGLTNFLKTTLPGVLKAVSNGIIGIASGIPNFITKLIIFLFIFVGVLTSRDKLYNTVKELSPFSPEITKRYTSRVGSMAKAMVKGQMLIALLQGIASAGALAIVGFSEYFIFFTLIFTFLSFIPLGAGIITIPLGILLILFGNVSGGIIVLVNHFVVVTNIDNYVRPKVVPKDAQLHAALTILGAFAGVSYFGFLGVIYGPIIMIFVTTTIESYIEQKKIK